MTTDPKPMTEEERAAAEWAQKHNAADFGVFVDPVSGVRAAFLAGVEYARPKWISVEERLPDRQGEYFVYSTVDPRLSVKTFDYLGKACYAISTKSSYPVFPAGFYIDSIHTPEVTHWMPLPREPKEANE